MATFFLIAATWLAWPWGSPGSPTGNDLEQSAPEDSGAITQRPGASNSPCGVYINVQHPAGIDWVEFQAACRAPAVSGVQFQVRFAELRPTRSRWDWGRINRALRRLPTGKKAVLVFAVGPPLPDWIVSDLAKADALLPGNLPVYWHPAYQSAIEETITRLAARYDGDSRIAFIRTGGWQWGTNEPNFLGDTISLEQADALRARGWDGERKPRGKTFNPAGGIYAKSILAIMDFWAGSFNGSRGADHSKKTPLGLTVRFPRPSEPCHVDDLVEHGIKLGWIMGSTGLNACDQTADRTALAAWAKLGATPAWMGITHLDDQCCTGCSMDALRWQAAREAVGDAITSPPQSGARIMIVGPDWLDTPELTEWTRAQLCETE